MLNAFNGDEHENPSRWKFSCLHAAMWGSRHLSDLKIRVHERKTWEFLLGLNGSEIH